MGMSGRVIPTAREFGALAPQPPDLGCGGFPAERARDLYAAKGYRPGERRVAACAEGRRRRQLGVSS
jgi:hypothetical protein